MENEKRLIDANELIDRLNHTTTVAYPNLFPGLLAAAEIVDDAPTVDAVEVVRCKDCKWRNTRACPYMLFNAVARTDKDYCSDGERMES